MTKRVLVTGANGHVGYNLIQALVSAGHRVRASIREAGDALKAKPIRELGINDIVSLDVRDTDQFIEACEGIQTVFHVAATYQLHLASKSAEESLLRDSLDGTTAAFAAAKANGVEKVIMTSSVVTLPLSRSLADPVDETTWQDDLRVPYFRAKTLAEQQAWQLADRTGVELATILPAAVVGPGFSRRTSSTDFIESIMLGSMRLGAPPASFPMVDARDVATAHVLAMRPEAKGRFIVAHDHTPTMLEICRMMEGIDPSVSAATRLVPEFALRFAPAFDWLNHKITGSPRLVTPEIVATSKGKWSAPSNARAKGVLGWRPTFSLEQSLSDTMARLREIRSAEAARSAASI